MNVSRPESLGLLYYFQSFLHKIDLSQNKTHHSPGKNNLNNSEAVGSRDRNHDRNDFQATLYESSPNSYGRHDSSSRIEESIYQMDGPDVTALSAVYANGASPPLTPERMALDNEDHEVFQTPTLSAFTLEIGTKLDHDEHQEFFEVESDNDFGNSKKRGSPDSRATQQPRKRIIQDFGYYPSHTLAQDTTSENFQRAIESAATSFQDSVFASHNTSNNVSFRTDPTSVSFGLAASNMGSSKADSKSKHARPNLDINLTRKAPPSSQNLPSRPREASDTAPGRLSDFRKRLDLQSPLGK
jgi:hypothetical protein